MQLYPAAIEQPGLLRRRIFRVLERGPAVPIGELRLRLGVEDEVLRRELDGLAAGGEIERLRPVNDAGEEHDFYVLAAAGRTGRTSVSSAGSNQVLTKCLQRTRTRVV